MEKITNTTMIYQMHSLGKIISLKGCPVGPTTTLSSAVLSVK